MGEHLNFPPKYGNRVEYGSMGRDTCVDDVFIYLCISCTRFIDVLSHAWQYAEFLAD